MFNSAMFFATVGGAGGALFILAAIVWALYFIANEDEIIIGIGGGLLGGLIGIVGLASSVAFTNGWEVVS
jgi:hypothetical protein